MCLLSVVKGLEQGTRIDRRTSIADIGDMNPDSADFFHEFRAMLVTTAKPTHGSGTAFASAFVSAEGRSLDFANEPVLARIEGIAGFSRGDFYRILPDFP